MEGLLWSGFRVRVRQDRREPPIPILVHLLFAEPYPKNVAELRTSMENLFRTATSEWIRGLEQYGNHFEVAP